MEFPLAKQFTVGRIRRPVRSIRSVPNGEQQEEMNWIDDSIGKRYRNCTLEGFRVSQPSQQLAVDACRKYVESFGKNLEAGVSIVFVGPRGTGKDHLMIATLKAILLGYPRFKNQPPRAIYRDGLSLFSEFRESFNRGGNLNEETLIRKYSQTHLMAVSDPLPPQGELSNYEQRILFRIIDRRYRECLPMALTCNVMDRNELDQRMGAQAADRVCDSAVVVKCNWESYRRTKLSPQHP